MRSSTLLSACAALFSVTALADSNLSEPLSSQQILPDSFKPPQVFQNVNLLRSTNLEKGYIRETVNVVIENVDSKVQDQYYIPFSADVIGNVGGLEVRDKKNPGPAFKSEVVEYDPNSSTQFFLTTLPTPLPPKSQLTLSITYHILSSLVPLPKKISQQERQYLLYTFSTYTPSAYPTLKQKTKLKFPTTDIPDVIGGGNPDRQGSTFTYGPYNELVPAGAREEASVRYEFTKPLIYATHLERDIEVSHWGGNLATEERYWLTNQGAQLKENFNRVQWAATQYYNPPTSALRELKVPLKAGSMNPYFTDDIGNVSTSRFRPGGSKNKEAMLELKPRYPVFGGWKYSFRIGWDADLVSFLRKLGTTPEGGHVLKVPFLEGPKMGEGVSYAKVEVRVILPEGARNVRFETEVPLVGVDEGTHRTFMDTVGRTTLKLTAMNVVDEARDKTLIVTYDYPFSAAFRKPITIFLGVAAVFATAWGIGRLDVSIGKQS
ncbi:MAG: hypothetical protein L6R37_003495 [Teloschistes peruensis]|nr:MAG: hypothetical protein L6R37_003495 [Teloschistes peruensis]